MPAPWPEASPHLTRADLDDALALADDRGIALCRSELPDGVGTVWCDGVLYVSPRLEMCEYGRQIVDGVHTIAAQQDRARRPHLTTVPAQGTPSGPPTGPVGWSPRAAG